MLGLSKTCIKCKETKPLSEFHKSRPARDGLYTYCKSCVKQSSAAWYKINKEKCLKQAAEWYAANRERKLGTCKKWLLVNRKKKSETSKKYRRSHLKQFREYARRRRLLSSNRCHEIAKKYRLSHLDKFANDARKYRQKKPLETRVRNHIRNTIRRYNNIPPKREHSIKYLGCSWSEYKKYLETRFTEGMTWDLLKAGKIHIDHRRPLSWFNLTNEAERKAAFHFSNTQPLWAADNLRKNNRFAS